MEGFTYKATKESKVFIYWGSKLARTLAGKEAKRFIADAEGLDSTQLQLLMAKRTGNFKRGNER